MSNTLIKKDETRQNGRSITPHEPLSLFHKLQTEVNKLFEDATHGMGLSSSIFHSSTFTGGAKVDVKDGCHSIVVTAELPGVEMCDLDITATPNYVSIAGEKRAEKEENEKGYYHIERDYGYFRRVLPMPCEIESNQVDAVFKNGVLTITLPKTKAALEAEKKVTVKAG